MHQANDHGKSQCFLFCCLLLMAKLFSKTMNHGKSQFLKLCSARRCAMKCRLYRMISIPAHWWDKAGTMVSVVEPLWGKYHSNEINLNTPQDCGILWLNVGILYLHTMQHPEFLQQFFSEYLWRLGMENGKRLENEKHVVGCLGMFGRELNQNRSKSYMWVSSEGIFTSAQIQPAWQKLPCEPTRKVPAEIS